MRLLSVLALIGCPAPDADVAPELDPEVDAPVALEDTITPDALLAHLDALQAIADAHDGNRALGTTGYDASVDYAVEVLEGAGYTVTLEPFDVQGYDIGEVVLDVDVPLEDGAGALLWTVGGAATGAVVPVDVVVPAGEAENTSTSGCEAADFAGFPVGGIALVQRGSCTFQDKLANAYAAGAVAAVVFNEGQPGRTDRLDGARLDSDNAVPIPMLTVSYRDGVALVEAARAGVLTAQVDVEAGEVVVPSVNVLASTPDGDPDDVVLIGGHLDSVPAGAGINDNGTGVATVLEIALQVAALDVGPRRRVGFALWGAEEYGLAGSWAHARRAQEAGTLDQVAMYLNFDMVGSPNGGRFVYASDGLPDGSDDIADAFAGFFDRTGLAWVPVPLEGRSDHAGFAALGVPVGGLFSGAEDAKVVLAEALFGGEAGQPYDACYHRACDDLLNVDTVLMYEMARAAAHTTWDAAN